MSHAISGLLFDKDGTLFDLSATWGPWCSHFIDGLAQDDKPRAFALAASIEFVVETQVFLPGSPVLADTSDDIAACLLPHLTGWRLDDLIAYINKMAATAIPVPTVDSLPALLQGFLDRGLVLGVATNDAEDAARAHLRGADILEHFSFVAGFDSGFGRKPSPGQLTAFAGRSGIAPHRVAMIGDSVHDMEAAREAGMMAIAVVRGAHDPAALMGSADVVLEDIGDLSRWIYRLQ